MSTIEEAIRIERRFRGPPDSANGGYACGVVARHIHGDARVRLQSPPPLDRPLRIAGDEMSLRMFDAELVIAEAATVSEMREDVPDPVSYDVASEASRRFPWFTGHPFATCFVCGPERHPGDGLCIFPGTVNEREIVAAPWIPDPLVCDHTDVVRPEIVWAALDCPSWFGLLAFESGVRWALLGQLTARVKRLPHAGERCVVTGWSHGRDGRKLFGGAALFTDKGELLGHSNAVWIELKNQ